MELSVTNLLEFQVRDSHKIVRIGNTLLCLEHVEDGSVHYLVIPCTEQPELKESFTFFVLFLKYSATTRLGTKFSLQKSSHVSKLQVSYFSVLR